jgi:hypothetical protein
MDDTQELYNFKTRMLQFIDELIEQFPSEPSFIIIRIFVSDKIPVKDVLGRFMKECLPYRDLIKSRNEDFFLYSDFMFEKYASQVGTDEIKHFRKMWESDIMDEDDKNAVWLWLNMFIRLATKYYDNHGCIDAWEFNLEKECENVNKIVNV